MHKPAKRSMRFAVATSLLIAIGLPLMVAVGPSAASAAPHLTDSPLTASPPSVSFGNITLGDYSPSIDVTLTNNGATSVTVTSITIGGDSNDFSDTDNCTTLAVGATCSIAVTFAPGALGLRTATLTPQTGATPAPVIAAQGTGTEGYLEVTALGSVAAHGDATQLGGEAGTTLAKPIVGIAATGDDAGYWLAASDGGVFAFGDAPFFGSTGAIHLNKPIVGIEGTDDFQGYWLVASDGGVFTYGDAGFFGSTGGLHLNAPIVGMAPTPDDEGYWLVAADGGVFAYGDAPFWGSAGSLHLNAPIVGMATTPDGGGYWLVASDGGVFAYGDANFWGSTGAIHLNMPIVGIAATPDGGGYWLMAADGGIFTFGDAPFYGSSAGTSFAAYVGFAGDAPPTLQAVLDQPADRRLAPQARTILSSSTFTTTTEPSR